MNGRYRTPMGALWFMGRPGFRRFMIRELTSVFVAAYLVFLLVWLVRLGQGQEAAMLESARRPWPRALHVIALIAALYHSITWFNLTPKIMPMYLGEDRMPDTPAAIAMGYGPWLACTGLVLWGLLG